VWVPFVPRNLQVNSQPESLQLSGWLKTKKQKPLYNKEASVFKKKV